MARPKTGAEVILNPQELQVRAASKKVTFYKKLAADWAKRAVNAEQKLFMKSAAHSDT